MASSSSASDGIGVGEPGLDGLIRPLFDQLVEARKTQPDLDLFDVVERSLVIHALRACGGNQARAALLLGISRSTLRKRIARYGLSIQTHIERQEQGEST
jgi:DNA-binding NtrC family response regulator